MLGIDPGSIKIGYALVEGDKKKIKLLNSGIFNLETSVDFLLRIKEIFSLSQKLIKDLNPHEIAIESLIFKKSPTALIKLAQARGAILSALLQTHCGKIFEYSPNLIKSSTTGYGHASKESIQKGLGFIIGQRQYQTFDESDAVATAICHLTHRNFSLHCKENNKTTNELKKKFNSTSSKNRGFAKSLNHLISSIE